MKKIIIVAFIASISFVEAQVQKGRDFKEEFSSPGPVNEKPARGNPKHAVVVSKEGEVLNINDATAGSYEVKQNDKVVGQLVIKSNGDMVVVPAVTKNPDTNVEKPKAKRREE